MLPACTDMKQPGLITLVYNSIHRLPTGVRRSAVMATNHQNECQRSTFMKNHRCVKKFLNVASLCLFKLNFLFLSLLLCLGLSTKTFCLGLENNFIWLKIAVSVAKKWLEMSPGHFKTRPGLVYLKTVRVGLLSCEEKQLQSPQKLLELLSISASVSQNSTPQRCIAAFYCIVTNVLFDSYFYLYIKPILCRCSFSFQISVQLSSLLGYFEVFEQLPLLNKCRCCTRFGI